MMICEITKELDVAVTV